MGGFDADPTREILKPTIQMGCCLLQLVDLGIALGSTYLTTTDWGRTLGFAVLSLSIAFGFGLRQWAISTKL